MIDGEYVRLHIDELMQLFCEINSGLSRSSKSQHRKAMLLDWTKMSYKPVVVLYYERESEKQRRRCSREMNELRDQEINQLKRDKTKLIQRIDFKRRLKEKEDRDHERVKNEFNALQRAVLEVATDKDLRSINVRFDTITSTHGPLLKRPFQSVLKANPNLLSEYLPTVLKANETNETNETNQSCQPTKEPLEVIDLDEIYKKQVVEIKTNG
jgi:hypothetical protein